MWRAFAACAWLSIFTEPMANDDAVPGLYILTAAVREYLYEHFDPRLV